MSYFSSITEKRRKCRKDVIQLLDKSEDFCRDNTTLDFNDNGKIDHLSKILD